MLKRNIMRFCFCILKCCKAGIVAKKLRQTVLSIFLGVLGCSFAYAENVSEPYCTSSPQLFKHFCTRLHQIWNEGSNELYLTGYAWHNRYTYTPDRIKNFNERAYGGGLGKGFFDEDRDWHGLYAFAFLDSHSNVEPIAGYAFLKMLHPAKDLNTGLGFAAFLTSRVDIIHSIPFPGIVPYAGINFKKVWLQGIYIPGSSGAGNVLFVTAKITL